MKMLKKKQQKTINNDVFNYYNKCVGVINQINELETSVHQLAILTKLCGEMEVIAKAIEKDDKFSESVKETRANIRKLAKKLLINEKAGKTILTLHKEDCKKYSNKKNVDKELKVCEQLISLMNYLCSYTEQLSCEVFWNGFHVEETFEN